MRTKILLMVTAFAVAAPAMSSDALRCRHRLVTEGDPKAKVAELCGQPAHAEQRAIYRSGLPRQSARSDSRNGRSSSDAELVVHNRSLVEVQVDVWTYNFGRSRFMREVVFHDNRVVEVNKLGRGY